MQPYVALLGSVALLILLANSSGRCRLSHESCKRRASGGGFRHSSEPLTYPHEVHCSYIACGPEGDANTRIQSPGTGDRDDAIAADEAGGWSDFNEIGSFPQAGDPVHAAAAAQDCGPGSPNFDPNDPFAGQGEEVPLDPSVSVVERYGEPGDSEAQALREAAAACVVFEPVDEEAAALLLK
jgi:hypothetical protein